MTTLSLADLVALRGAAHGLTLRGRRRARATLLGEHSSAQRGRGLEFQEVRPYAAGDDPRSIDWRVTARRGRPHTKLYREERERPVWLLVDLQPGTFFGSRRQLKSTLIVRTAALLAWVATLGGDRIGAVIAGAAGGVRVLPARGRLEGVLPLLEAVLEAQPMAPGKPAPQLLGEAVRALGAVVRPGSQVLAISDFSGTGGPEEDHWIPIARHNDVQLYWITDPLESNGLPPGRFRVGLPGRLLVLDGRRARSAWLAAWQARARHVTELSQRLAAPVVRLDTAQSVEAALRPVLSRGRPAA
jgi:uncharacterized protein (DUF58 family)